MDLKKQFSQKIKFCHHLHTVMLFQTDIIFFLLKRGDTGKKEKIQDKEIQEKYRQLFSI